jgi:hypothetical protein
MRYRVKSNIVLRSQIGLQLWKIWMQRWKLIVHGETIRENKKISTEESLGYFKLKKRKPWFDEGCSKLLDQKKQGKLHGYRIQVQ